MLRFLFWNLNRKPLETLVQRIVAAHDVDIVILAEMNATTPNEMAAALSHALAGRPFNYLPTDYCDKVEIFGRFDPLLVRPVYDTARLSMRHFVLPGRDSLIVAGVHLPSKLHLDDPDQWMACVSLCRDLAVQESKLGHDRTILVGDFNMNPFEHGVASSRGLNAVMTRAIAGRGSRIVDTKRQSFFYNPMWNHFGERGPNPSGTYYYEGSPHMWNTFDQLLVRPFLQDRFLDDELRILTEVGGLPLVAKRGTPNANVGSDHLPLLFALNL